MDLNQQKEVLSNFKLILTTSQARGCWKLEELKTIAKVNEFISAFSNEIEKQLDSSIQLGSDESNTNESNTKESNTKEV